MQSLHKENMKFVSGAGNESLFGSDHPLILVIVTKPEQLSKIQDFFQPKVDSAQQTAAVDRPSSSDKTPANSPAEQPKVPEVVPMVA